MMKHGMLAVALALSLAVAGCAGEKPPKVETKEVTYSGGGVLMKGYLAYDANQEGKLPGVLVVHEWWGHNEYARKRARMLAELGYIALAVDMYGEGKQATHPEDAGKFASEVMRSMDTAKARFLAALEFIRQQPATDAGRVAAIGYCFGGGVVLHMARSGVDLRGVASFHGSLATEQPAQPGTVKAAVLVCNGADDGFVTQEQIDAFQKEMADAGVDFQFKSYPGAKHSFTNPDADKFGKEFGLPLAYNEAADKQSWTDMQVFLTRVFGR